MKDKKIKALVAVMMGNGIFGFSFLFSKVGLGITIPSVLIAIRFTVAFLMLNLIVIVGGFIRKSDGAPLIKFSLAGKPFKEVLLLALFQPVIYFIAENYGIKYTSSAFAGIIIAVIPIIGVVLDVVIVHSKVTRTQVLCAIGSVLGVAITTIGAKDMNSSAIGTVLLLIAVVAGSMFYVLSNNAGNFYNPIERTYVMFAVGSAVYIIIAAVQCYGKYDELVLNAIKQPTFWGCIVYLAIFSSVIAFILLNYGSSHVSVSQASMFANLSTVISILAGVIILHETFTIQQGIGAAIILGSVYLANR